MRRPRAQFCIAAAVVAAGVAGCGGGGGAAPPSDLVRSDPGLQHIHGLGVQRDALYIATHSGLWVAPAGEAKARRFGQSRQDVMGFSVVGERHFIGSGHPSLGQELPANLGLIESRDGGKTWTNVALLGQADFHVLESAGPRVYGYDGTQGRLLVSSDGGRRWNQRTPPAALLGLAIHPRSPDHVVAATEHGLFRSQNAGRAWRGLSLRDPMTGLLAWPARDRLFLIDASGRVHRSVNGGRRWAAVGEIGGQPAAFEPHDEQLYAALHDGTVKRSTDGGRTWTLRATP
jgi:photosystem II stability/assembly factor-like uncharacterized protein